MYKPNQGEKLNIERHISILTSNSYDASAKVTLLSRDFRVFSNHTNEKTDSIKINDTKESGITEKASIFQSSKPKSRDKTQYHKKSELLELYESQLYKSENDKSSLSVSSHKDSNKYEIIDTNG